MDDYLKTKFDDKDGIKTTKIEFYSEDIKILNKMSDEEAIKYKAKLIEQGKYTLNWND